MGALYCFGVFFHFQNCLCHAKRNVSTKSLCFKMKKYFNNTGENALMLLEHFPLLSSPSPLFFLNKVLAVLNQFCKVQISTVQHILTEVFLSLFSIFSPSD